uniref:Uncharacterized protein n=1 Tax=Salix viminalis TaxID=40686 RepID=A0A6N2KAT4_SALVM
MRVAAGATGEELGGDQVYSDIFKWSEKINLQLGVRLQNNVSDSVLTDLLRAMELKLVDFFFESNYEGSSRAGYKFMDLWI